MCIFPPKCFYYYYPLKSCFLVPPDWPTNQPVQLLSLMFFPLKTVFRIPRNYGMLLFQFGPNAVLNSGRRIDYVNKVMKWNLCYRTTKRLIISSAHFYQWRRVTSASSRALIISSSALLSWFLPADFITSFPTSHRTLSSPHTKQRGGWTSNHVGIKLLTRVWQVGEAVPLKCKADVSGSNNEGVFSLSSLNECWSEFCHGLNSRLALKGVCS